MQTAVRCIRRISFVERKVINSIVLCALGLHSSWFVMDGGGIYYIQTAPLPSMLKLWIDLNGPSLTIFMGLNQITASHRTTFGGSIQFPSNIFISTRYTQSALGERVSVCATDIVIDLSVVECSLFDRPNSQTSFSGSRAKVQYLPVLYKKINQELSWNVSTSSMLLLLAS